MTYTQQTAGINEEQKAAVETEQNAVIAAGAGSGKTRVLATRYLYLILHKNTVEEILALTFTRKAAAEMRGRIYGMLAENGSPEAKAAAAAFHAARIETLDSFCASICREGCRAYGITPAFAIDDGYLEQKAEQAALDFILRNRESKAVRALLKTFSLRDLPGKLLVQACQTLQGADIQVLGWGNTFGDMEGEIQNKYAGLKDGSKTPEDVANELDQVLAAE